MKNLGLSTLISDGMIIQLGSAFPIWSLEKITINFLNKTYEATEADGKWLVTLDPVQAGSSLRYGPFTMEIISEETAFTIKDIYAGDVWLCSGQSNMEMQMDRLQDDFGEEWQQEDFPLVRQFKAPQEWDFSGPCDELTGGNWLSPSAETLQEFSGTAWFFAKKLYEKYRIPIGLVNTAWGGTPVEAWMSRDALANYPDKIEDGEQYANPAKREKITKETGLAIQEWETRLINEDQGLSGQWQNPVTDLSGWNELTLPGNFSEAGLAGFCGVIWLAKEFDVTSAFSAEKTRVWLGTIVDSDTVYINGVEIGNTGYRYPPRKYIPKDLLKEGKNRIVIRVICNNGEGGVTRDKPFKIFTEDESIELAGTWKYKTGTASPTRPADFFIQRSPMGNYNAMIAPVLKYPLRGVIWYQGESNDPNPHEYAVLFQTMIQDWREKNGNPELPFLFVQLPIFGEPYDNNEKHSWAVLREAQAAALALPNTGMAAALELGEWNDIHPINKKDVGIRLYLAAEKTLYNEENTSPGPVFRRFERRQENLVLFFDNCGNGLKTESGEKAHVTVIGGGDQNTRLPAEIKGTDIVSIDLSSVKDPKKVLYAWANNPRDRQLFNSDGLPAIPFKIEL